MDYTNYDDMKYAVSCWEKSFDLLHTCFGLNMIGDVSAFQIRKLDDTEFRNPWARAYIRVTIPFCHFNNLVGLLLG